MHDLVKALADHLIEHDPKGEHVSMWVEEWTDEEIERIHDPGFLPLRFHHSHPGVRFDNCVDACFQGSHLS